MKGYVLIPEPELESVMEELPIHITKTKAEKGCLIFDVSRDASQQNKLNVYEEFLDKASFENHQKRVSDSKWGEVTKNCDRHYEITGM